MNTSPAHSLLLPQLEQNGKRLTSDMLDSQELKPASKSRNTNSILHRRSHSRSPSNCSVDQAGTCTQDCNDSTNTNSSNARDHGNGSLLLSDRQQRTVRDRSKSCNSNLHGSPPTSLTLSITPPSFTSSYLNRHPSSSQYHSNSQDQHQQSTNNLLGSHGSLGPSLSQPSNPFRSGVGARRASFNLSSGSLNFHNTSFTSSLGSPSSPSYSTIAVARARAQAAAAVAAARQGVAEEDEEEYERRIKASEIFPGTSVPTSSYGFQAPVQSTYPSHYPHQSHPELPQDLSSSSNSLLSSDSMSSIESTSGVSVPMSITHLQENAKAEREISMIIDNFLYLGGELVEEEQIEELQRLGIKRVLNMAANCDDELWVRRFNSAEENAAAYLKVGLLDHVDQDLKEGLEKAIKFIGSSKDPVYVHCQAGKSRSVATVIGYLIQGQGWPLKRAYDLVVERRRIMSPNIGFVSQLIMLEECILGQEKAGGLVNSMEDSEEVNPTLRTTIIP